MHRGYASLSWDTVAAFVTALVLEDRTCRQRRQDTKTGLLQLAGGVIGVIAEDDASPTV
jgi:hypothetical protein